MKFIFLFLLLTLYITQVSIAAKRACNITFGKSGICADIKFTAPISRKNDATFNITFFDSSDEIYQPSKKPEVYLWMIMKNGHEHGSEKLKRSFKDGKYYFTNAWLLMLGQWYINVKLEKDGKKYHERLPVCVKKMSSKSHIGVCK